MTVISGIYGKNKEFKSGNKSSLFSAIVIVMENDVIYHTTTWRGIIRIKTLLYESSMAKDKLRFQIIEYS